MLELSDEELIQKTKEGNSECFDVLVTRYQKNIYNFCYKFLPCSEDAEEATIDTFVKVFNNSSVYDPQFKFSTWLYSIARNCSLDIYRKQKKHNTGKVIEFDTADKAKLPEEEVIGKDKENELHEAFLKLDETKRIALILYIYHEHTYKDIADVLMTSENNVKNIIFRARQSLKEILGSEYERK